MRTNILDFQPLLGLSSSHLQTVVSSFLPVGSPPPSKSWIIDIEEGDQLSCEVSIPPAWKETDQTVILIHGLGGCHHSGYMVRVAKKFYLKGYKAVRINLRGCGSGIGLSKLPYHAGTSSDVLKVLQSLKKEAPHSEISLVGFSLGGNVTLKLAGELGKEARALVKTFIAICAPLDLAECVQRIQAPSNRLYHNYYLQKMRQQALPWTTRKLNTIHEFDDLIIAPLWGYQGALEYYQDCSSLRFLPFIRQSTRLLFALDDPFISPDGLQDISLPEELQVWTTERGGHMGFLGKAPGIRSPYWMDHILLKWVEEAFKN